MQLNQIRDHVYYLDGAVNLGVLTGPDGSAVLVDAGLDESASRKARRLIEEAGFILKGIIITHAHADHYGGAAFLVKSSGARIYASAAEKGMLETTIIEPLYLFGGAYPPADLRGKFFSGPSIKVDQIVEPGRVCLEGIDLEIVDLQGHSIGQIGVAKDGVLFCADAFVGSTTLEKHGVPLNASLADTLATFDRIESRSDTYFVPCHGQARSELGQDIALNRQRVQAVLAYIVSLLDKPHSTEEVSSAVFEHFKMHTNGLGFYYLANLTVMAYIGYLLENKTIKASYQNGRQFFSLKSETGA